MWCAAGSFPGIQPLHPSRSARARCVTAARLSPGDHAKPERKGVVLPFPPDESWPVHKNPFEYIMRPTHLAVVVVPDAGKGIVRAI